ncbi:Putative teichuronic acid biosynthesis glycosyltransferase TuaH [Bacillus sp. THAF10]|nr:Putative teichuronic acid biosynthesis glycosyltransferase TuaH [Bacillus sp. THAF10]
MELLSTNLFLVHDDDKWFKETLPIIKKRKNCKIGIWCTWAKLAKELERYQADWIIYDCVDEFADWMKYEEEMIEVANAVTCTAERIFLRLKKAYPNKKIELLPNAYDESMGLHLPASKSSPFHDRKQIGYIGAWAPWIDDLLVKRLARTFNDDEIVIIGVGFGRKFNLGYLSNVTYLGHLPHHQLGTYLKEMSVCIIPFKITPVTLATNPVKMYEYLATGKPVISTALPECVLAQPYVDIGRNHSDFVTKVKYRLEHPGDSTGRQRFALSNTWKHRINQAISLINSIS